MHRTKTSEKHSLLSPLPFAVLTNCKQQAFSVRIRAIEFKPNLHLCPILAVFAILKVLRPGIGLLTQCTNNSGVRNFLKGKNISPEAQKYFNFGCHFLLKHDSSDFWKKKIALDLNNHTKIKKKRENLQRAT